MEKHALILATFTLLPAFFDCRPAVAQAVGAARQRKELQNIQQQLNERKKELEEYKRQEEELNRAISALKSEDVSDRRKQSALRKQLSEAQEKKLDSEQKYKALQSAYGQWVFVLADETAEYVWRQETEFPYYGKEEIFSSMFAESALRRKYALLARLKGEGRQIRQSAEKWDSASRQLKSKTGLIETRLSTRRSAWNEKLSALNETRQKYQQILKEVEELKNSATGLNRLVQKLESKSPYRSREKAREIPIPRHSLPWPAAGRVISGFGREEVRALKTWLVREGIRIETARSGEVRSVLGGKVIYSGLFRSYGKVVILDHKEGFFTVYGLLDDITVKKGEWVNALSMLGLAGVDTQEIAGKRSSDSGAVYFEIRSGADAVDPVPWLVKR